MSLAQLVRRVLKDHPGLLAPPDRRALPVLQASQVRLVPKDSRVVLASLARLVRKVHQE